MTILNNPKMMSPLHKLDVYVTSKNIHSRQNDKFEISIPIKHNYNNYYYSFIDEIFSWLEASCENPYSVYTSSWRTGWAICIVISFENDADYAMGKIRFCDVVGSGEIS